MAKVLIDKDKPLNPGDRIELHFVSSGMAWIKAMQIVLLEQKMKGRKDWEITGWETPVDSPTLLIMRVEVLGGPRPVDEAPMQTAGAGVVITCASIAAVIIACGVVYSLTLKETFLTFAAATKAVAESPAGKVAAAGTGIGLAAAGIAALILIFLPKK